MNPLIAKARLYVVGAAGLTLLGGMLFAVGRWNATEDDRAFVAAAAQAARMPDAPALPPRYWTPTAGARPGPTATQRIEAAERLRTMPPSPPSPTTAPGAKPAAAAP
jgi:hypothetical protein